MCRSPSLCGPPSIAAFDGTGYGPLSLSDAYSKLTRTFGWLPDTVVIGIPIGAPSHVPEPKSACTGALRPMLDTYVDDFANTGRCETSACHTLSAGRSEH